MSLSLTMLLPTSNVKRQTKRKARTSLWPRSIKNHVDVINITGFHRGLLSGERIVQGAVPGYRISGGKVSRRVLHNSRRETRQSVPRENCESTKRKIRLILHFLITFAITETQERWRKFVWGEREEKKDRERGKTSRTQEIVSVAR